MSYSPEVLAIMERPTCSADEAAFVLGVSRGQVYMMIKRGDVPSLKLGHRVVVPTRQLMALIEGVDAGVQV